VFTGQTVSNQGGPSATTAHVVTVAAAPPTPPTPTTPTPGTTPPTSPAPPTSTTPTTPVAILSALRVRRHASPIGRRVDQRCVKTTRHNRGRRHCGRPFVLQVQFALSARAVVTFTLVRQTAGRRVDSRCVAPAAHNRRHHRCTRLIRVPGHFTRTRGADTGLTVRLSGRALRPGTYRLTATPSGGTPHTTAFTISECRDAEIRVQRREWLGVAGERR
jgi:hypothetical protein